MTEVADSDGTSVSYTLDNVGQVASLVTSSGLTLNYQYNNQGLATNVYNSSGTFLSVIYDEGDRPITVTDAQGVSVTNEFDGIGNLLTRLTSLGVEHNDFGWVGITEHEDTLGHASYYGYDATGHLATYQDANGNTNGYTYNPLRGQS